MRIVFLFSFFCLGVVNSINAKTLLVNNAEIWNGLLQISVANKVSEDCELIDARRIKGLIALFEIKSVARNLGFTNEEISEFVNSQLNRESLSEQTNKYLVDNGVDLNQPSNICIFGQKEIDNKTRIGSLLRVKK